MVGVRRSSQAGVSSSGEKRWQRGVKPGSESPQPGLGASVQSRDPTVVWRRARPPLLVLRCCARWQTEESRVCRTPHSISPFRSNKWALVQTDILQRQIQRGQTWPPGCSQRLTDIHAQQESFSSAIGHTSEVLAVVCNLANSFLVASCFSSCTQHPERATHALQLSRHPNHPYPWLMHVISTAFENNRVLLWPHYDWILCSDWCTFVTNSLTLKWSDQRILFKAR